MTDRSVVLPQPDGPDDHRHLAGVDVPVDATASAWTRCSPVPKCLLRPRIRTATDGTVARSSRRCGSTGRRRDDAATVMIPLDDPRESRQATARMRPDPAQRKTIAGSSRITRCTLSRLDRMQISTIAPAVIGSSCQGV